MSLGRGAIVDSRYRILERAGQGSQAVVYLAEEIEAGGRRVALKVFRDPGADAGAMSRELGVLQGLDDPSLVRVLGSGRLSPGGPTYLALEWVDGADFLEAARLLPLTDLRRLLAQLCRGLDYLHRSGVVHGDLKPSNVRVTRRAPGAGQELRLKILDFGLARAAGHEPRSDGGTLAYAAPEVLRGTAADGRADLYALGVLLYQVLTGTLPFDVSDPAAALRGHLEESPRPIDLERTGAPADLAEIATRLMMKDPEDRFASARDVADVLGLAEAVQGALPSRSPAELHPPALVGRSREIDALRDFLAGHPSGKAGPGLALILGEGGIGKSRLLAELVAVAAEHGIAAHRGSCHETGGAPFGAFLDVLRWAVQTAESLGLRTEAGDDGPSADLVDRYGSEVVKVVPGAFRREVSPSPELQPRYERLRLIDAVGTFLLEVSRARPFVLAVEDLHWADDASADLVDYLLRNRGRGRLGLAAAARPAENRVLWLKESLEREGGPGSVLRLHLGRLGEEDVADLARSALGLPEPPTDLAAHLQRETAGNPFFVVELLRDLVEDGAIAWREGAWSWDDSALRRRPPSSGIAQALERRIARSSGRELALLRSLALLDRTVDLSLLVAVASASPIAPPPDETASPAVFDGPGDPLPLAWEAALDHLIDRGLVLRTADADSPRFAIAHDAARGLLQRGIDEESRRALHRTAARELEARFGPDSEEAIERIAYHFIQAGDDERSARYCVRAARKARRLYANEEASYFYLQALKYHTDPADPTRWDALGSLGDVYLLQGKVAHARTRYEEMRKLAEAAGDAEHMVAAYLGLAETARKTSDYPTQAARARTAFLLALRANTTLGRADALQVLGLAHYEQGRFHKALRCYSAALSLLRSSGDVRITSNVINRMGLAVMSQGKTSEAKALFLEAMEIARVHGLRILSAVENNLGCVAESTGSYSEALGRYRACEVTARAGGDRYYTTLGLLNQAMTLVRLRALQQGEPLARRALRMAVELGERRLQGYLTILLAQIHRAQGHFTDSRAYLDDAQQAASKIGHLEIRLLADLERSRLHLDEGDCDTSANLADRTLRDAAAATASEFAAAAAITAAEACRRQGRLVECERFLSESWRFLARTSFPEIEWTAHLVTGKCYEAQGRSAEADSHFKAGSAILDLLAAGISDSRLLEGYLRDPERLELRLKGARALQRGESRNVVATDTRRMSASYRRLEAASELSRNAQGLSTPEEVLHALVGSALGAIDAERAIAIGRTVAGSDHVLASLQVGTLPSPPDSPWSRRLLNLAWQGRSGWIGEDLTGGIDGAESIQKFGIRSAAAVPIGAMGRTYAVLYLDSRVPSGLRAEEVRFLELLAGQAALILAASGCAERDVVQGVVQEAQEDQPEHFGGMLGRTSEMRSAFDRLRRVAPSLAPVLLEGESGTGKELAARALHQASSVANGPFVAIDSGALPEGLAEAELFGCVRGAFSGATEARPGLIASASEGTLFLDEVGNMSPLVQAKLLRVLQCGEVRRVGATVAQSVRFRLIAATNCNLKQEMQTGRFRSDLYYRIAGFTIRLPPLRARQADVLPLAEHFLGQLCMDEGREPIQLTPNAIECLLEYDWPGNVRELRNVLQTALVLTQGRTIARRDLVASMRGQGGDAGDTRNRTSGDLAVDQLLAELRATGGDKAAAARRLGWSRMRVYRVLGRAGIVNSRR